MAVIRGPQIVINGLQLYLDAGNRRSYPGSGNIWYDLSGKSRNGTLINSPTYSTNDKGYIQFDGTNKKITVGNPNVSFNNFTLEFWFKPTILNGTQDIILDMDYRIRFEINSNKIKILLGNGSSWSFTNQFSSNLLILNKWYNGVLTYDGSNSILYLDNVFESSRSFSNIQISSGLITLGQYTQISTTYAYNGYIASMKLYNRILNSNEILQNYNALKGRYL